MKSSVDEIRERFDKDVERFSNLDSGQEAAMDSALCTAMIARAAADSTPDATQLLDIGCGAGNYSLRLLQRIPGLNVTLVDLSQPMLERAQTRVKEAGASSVKTMQGDIRELNFGKSEHDIILAASVLHHLRTDAEWHAVFYKFYTALRPGGGFWVYDLVDHDIPAVQWLQQERYGEYLMNLKGPEYRQKVFDYVEKEDTPRSLIFQTTLLSEVGFRNVSVLHKNGPFAAFGALK